MSNIGVYIELKEGQYKKFNNESLGFAKNSGKDVYAVLFSDNPEQYADQLKGIKTVINVKGAKTYDPAIYADTMATIITDYNLTDFVGVCSARGKDLFPRTAAKIESASLLNDCVAIDLETSHFTKPVYAGKLVSTFVMEDEYRMFTLRPNIFSGPSGSDGADPEIVNVEPVKKESGSKIVDLIKSESKRIDLTEAEIIVSGGRSLKSKENFEILEKLSSALGAGLGASRAAVDAGYASHDMQVGQTGKVVNPKLYIACGISGAIQHFVGMKTSKVIVAINKDPEAPIFKKADYGIVGDLFEIVPLLTEELSR
ncbi:MAG: electron transfer flavoprotein subunit alpha/FixB family protein [bacterium]|nr:electron transfer flavoprotein subunit alpha/FixB family protein [bacterium]